MLRYEHIEYLNFLFGIPVLILAMLLYSRWKKKALALFGNSQLVKELMHSFSKSRTQIKNILTVLIFILLIIGIANPQVGTKMEEVKREGVDLMIAIDLSNSMLAEDIKPNRIERAKLAISLLLGRYFLTIYLHPSHHSMNDQNLPRIDRGFPASSLYLQ